MAALPPTPGLVRLELDFRAPSGQGWSEGHYLLPGTSTGLDASTKTLVDYRLAILPPSCRLIYAKYSTLGNPRDSEPLDYGFPTAGLWPGDPFTTPATEPPPESLQIEIAEIAVHLRVLGNDGKSASRWVHGVPDNRVSAEVLTEAIVQTPTAPPAIGAGTFSTNWSVRFGYYVYQMKTLTVYGQRQIGAGGVPFWGSEGIKRVIIRGVGKRDVGKSYGLRRGRAPVGR